MRSAIISGAAWSSSTCSATPPTTCHGWPRRSADRGRGEAANPSDALSVARLARKWRELQLVRPARPVLGVQVVERLGDLYRVDHVITPVLVPRQCPGSGRVDGSVDHDVGDMHAVL